MDDTSAKDRRAHPRRETAIQMQGSPEAGGVVARMVARNLSLGGLYCTSTADFPEMTRLSVRLMLPISDHDQSDDSEPVDVEAVVVRRQELSASPSGKDRFQLALFFTKIEETSRARLSRYLKNNHP